MPYSFRSYYLVQLLIVVGILLLSFYLQRYRGMLPCPLCMMQRICFMLLAITFLFSLLTNGFFRQMGNLFSIFFSLLGILFAGRQIWVQHFPAALSNECGVTIQYMLQVLPIHEVAQKIFSGSAECTERGFNFLFLNLAEWSLLLFVLFLFMGLWLFKKTRLRR